MATTRLTTTMRTPVPASIPKQPNRPHRKIPLAFGSIPTGIATESLCRCVSSEKTPRDLSPSISGEACAGGTSSGNFGLAAAAVAVL